MDTSSIWCVVRGIPNSDRGHSAANRLRSPGFTTRKRGRGARRNPGNGWYHPDYGHMPASGGEYQDLPIERAARFSMYVATSGYTWPRTPNDFYYQFAGFTESGKLRVRPLTEQEYYQQ